jgi:hypothetical protein
MSQDAMPARMRLAYVLDNVGLAAMAVRARAGVYDDLLSDSPTPTVDLVTELRAVGRKDLAERAIAGEWLPTHEEAAAWARCYPPQDVIRTL